MGWPGRDAAGARPKPSHAVEGAVLQRLAEVGGADLGALVEVGDGAGDAPDAVEGAGREGHLLDRALEQAVGFGVEGDGLGQQRRGDGGVGSGAALELAGARLLATRARTAALDSPGSAAHSSR